MINNVINYSMKTDYNFSYKEFDFGDNFSGKRCTGIKEQEDLGCYLLYKDEFYY